MQSQTLIEYGAPENVTLEDDINFARGRDGSFYARVEIIITGETAATILFSLYLKVSEVDWRALRQGAADCVVGEIQNDLFADIGEQFCEFIPAEDGGEAAGWAHYDGRCSLVPVFEALAAQEAA